MISAEQCKGCGQLILLVEDGVTTKVDPAPLDDQTAVAALIDGRALYRIRYISGQPASLGSADPAILGRLRTAGNGERPMVVRGHRCPPGARGPVQVALGVAAGPKGSPAALTTPSWGPSTERSGVPDAGNPATRPETAPEQGPDGLAGVGRSPGPSGGVGGSQTPLCDVCREPCDEPGTWWGIEHAGRFVNAEHVERCSTSDVACPA